MTKLLHVAVGIVFNQQQEVLVCLRPTHKHQGGLWEFPGGKVETDESVEQALKRELAEEVGITVEQAYPLTQCPYQYTDRQVLLDVWRIEKFIGEAYGREGQEIQWVTREKLQQLPVLMANHPIITLLLPLWG